MALQPGKIIICPTPLGNLGDMTSRAFEALRTCDVVCCEDTRVTGKLLAALGIEGKRLERLDEATLGHAAPRFVQRAADGEVIAYCSDAGMPGVSDPGQRLIDAAYDAGVSVEVLPGGTAVATAYVASGFTAPSFYFGGFFPRKAGEQQRALDAVRSLDAVLVYYESPLRIVSALQSVAAAMPHRSVAVCRELTKLHEEVLRGPVAEVLETLQARDSIKGEIVLVIDAPNAEEQADDADAAQQKALARAEELLGEGELSKKDVVRALREEFGLSRNDAYEIVHGA